MYNSFESKILLAIIGTNDDKARRRHLAPPGGRLNKKDGPGMAIPMLKIRRPSGRLIFNMEIAIRR